LETYVPTDVMASSEGEQEGICTTSEESLKKNRKMKD